MILRWERRLARLRERADALLAADARPARLALDEGLAGYARLREAARPLLETAAEAFRAHCRPGYPRLEDNGIMGPGGSFGVRFSAWHAVHFAIENAKKQKKDQPRPKGLAGALEVRIKRMPGDPLPERDPTDRFELAVLCLRWDAERGWVEVRRVLPAAWTAEMLEELFGAYLDGLVYDVGAGLPQT